MRKTKNLEIMVGVFVLLGLLSAVVLAFQVSNVGSRLSAPSTYRIQAGFDNVGGLRTRAKVTLSGVSVGRVVSVAYDMQQLRAVVVMDIDRQYPLSSDTQASIYTAGLLGEQYISLEPGAEDEVLKDGDSLYLTQSALVLEEIVGKVLVNLTTKK